MVISFSPKKRKRTRGSKKGAGYGPFGILRSYPLLLLLLLLLFLIKKFSNIWAGGENKKNKCQPL
jgi:hypothetical protein